MKRECGPSERLLQAEHKAALDGESTWTGSACRPWHSLVSRCVFQKVGQRRTHVNTRSDCRVWDWGQKQDMFRTPLIWILKKYCVQGNGNNTERDSGDIKNSTPKDEELCLQSIQSFVQHKLNIIQATVQWWRWTFPHGSTLLIKGEKIITLPLNCPVSVPRMGLVSLDSLVITFKAIVSLWVLLASNAASNVNLYITEGQLGKPCNCVVTY